MCRISDKIKFCTCESKNYERLKHYWVLYRYNDQKSIHVLGEVMAPTSDRDPNFEINQFTIQRRLNEGDAFDVPMEFQLKDKLHVVINNDTNDGMDSYNYTFNFKNGKWYNYETDPFEFENEYDEEGFGKVRSALRK